MYKGKDCIGLTVVSEQTGQFLGKITDIICSANLKRIKYLQVVEKNNGETKQCLPSLISSIGRDAVIVNAKELPCLKEHKEKLIIFSKLKGIHIVCSDGTEIGEVVDILFEFPCCEIWGLEVSEGFIGDILTGRYSISNDNIKKISQDCILVDL